MGLLTPKPGETLKEFQERSWQSLSKALKTTKPVSGADTSGLSKPSSDNAKELRNQEEQSELAFSIHGGENEEGYEVEWKDIVLWYRRRSSAYALEPGIGVSPSPEAWTKFWQALEAAGVWQWNKSYEGFALDGTSWSLKLKHQGKTITAKGTNAYPGGEESEFSDACAFGQFIQALRELTGRNDIR